MILVLMKLYGFYADIGADNPSWAHREIEMLYSVEDKNDLNQLMEHDYWEDILKDYADILYAMTDYTIAWEIRG